MTPRWKKLEQLFHQASEMAPGERGAFVEAAAQGDESLRHDLESLLGMEEEAKGFLHAPAPLARQLRQTMEGDFLAGQSLGPYRLESLLEEGGMGLVFRARDSRNGELVACKVLPPEGAAQPQRVERFRKEAASLRSITHEAVVRLLDVGEQGGLHYLVMEFVTGRSLRQVLDEGAMETGQAEEYARQLLEALRAVHAALHLHCDIKPENIMVTAAGRLKLIDFGLASQAPLTLRQTVTEFMAAGTIGYAAPERLMGEAPTVRSDLFSAACLIYEMFAGQAPFEGKTAWAVADHILRRDPDFSPIPLGWRPVLRRCLKKSAGQRFGSVEEMQASISGARPRRILRWGGVGAVAAAALALAFVPVQAPDTVSLGLRVNPGLALSGDGEMVAFSRRDAENEFHSHIWVRSTRTAEERQLTFGGYEDRSPSLSSDGGLVYFQSNREPAGIYRVATQLRDEPRLTIEGGHSPSVSPDGKLLAYFSYPLSVADPIAGKAGIAVAPTQGGTPLWESKQYIPSAKALWAPDSAEFVVMAVLAGTHTIRPERIGVDGTVKPFREQLRMQPCGFTAGGEVLLRPNTDSPGLLAAGAGEELATRRLYAEAGRVEDCVSSKQVFGILRPEESALLWIPLEAESGVAKEGEEAKLDQRFPGVSMPSLTADGSLLLVRQVTKPREESHLAIDVATGRVTALASRYFGLHGPLVSPDRTAVISYDTRTLKSMLSWPSQQLLDVIDLTLVMTWDVGSGGRTLLTTTPKSIPRGIEVYETETRTSRLILAHPELNLYMADLSFDEQWVVFTGERDGASVPRIYAAPFHRNRRAAVEEWVDLGVGDYPRWSQNGRLIYFLDVSQPQPRVMAQTVDGLTKKPLGTAKVMHTFAGEWTLKDLPVGTFRMSVGRDALVMSVGRKETVLRRLSGGLF